MSSAQPLIVGRRREQDLLHTALVDSAHGQGRLVLLSGEAGIGKTTLVNWLAARAGQQGGVVFSGYAPNLETTPPYGPWLNAGLFDHNRPPREHSLTPERQRVLTYLIRHGPSRPLEIAAALDLSPNAATQALRRMLRDGQLSQPSYGTYAAARIEWATAQVGAGAKESSDGAAPMPEQAGESAPLASLGPVAAVEAVRSRLLVGSRDAPVLLILEDLHWADQSSLELLLLVGRELPRSSVLIAATFRDTDLSGSHPLPRLLPRLAQLPGAISIALSRLPSGDVGELVSSRYGLGPDDADRLTGYLDRYAEGNPFFAEEMMRTLELDRVLSESQTGWTLDSLPDFQVPPMLRQVIDDQFQRLGSEERRLLQVAAVIGLEIDFDMWGVVAGVSEDALAVTAEHAAQAGILVESVDRDALRFRHAMLREALYESVVLPRRRGWHGHVAELLMSRPAPDPDTVADHLAQARDDRAAEWLIRAARRAARANANVLAGTRFGQALAILSRDPARRSEYGWLLCEMAETLRYTDTRRALAYLDEAALVQSQLDDRALDAAVRWCRNHVRGFRGENVFAEMREASAHYGTLSEADRDRLARSPFRYAYNGGVHAQWLAQFGLFQEALDVAQRYLASAAPPVSPLEHYDVGGAYFGLGKTYAALGQPEAATEAYARARLHYQQTGNYHLIALCLDWELDAFLTYHPDRPAERLRIRREELAAWARTLFDEPAPHAIDILDGRWSSIREAAGASEALAVLYARLLAEVDRRQGKYDDAWARIRGVAPQGPAIEPGSTNYHNMIDLLRVAAETALDQRNPDSARPWIDAFERWLTWSGQAPGRSTVRLLRSRLHLLSGEPERALSEARAALDLANQPRQPLALLAAHLVLARLLYDGDAQAARVHLTEARSLAGACAAPHELALVRFTDAEFRNREGRADQARRLLYDARETAATLDAQPLLDHASRLERELLRNQLGTNLSPREVEVLRFVAEGLTDAEIGERLYISRRTVGAHLQSVFNKLGVNSRAAAIASAYARQILEIHP